MRGRSVSRVLAPGITDGTFAFLQATEARDASSVATLTAVRTDLSSGRSTSQLLPDCVAAAAHDTHTTYVLRQATCGTNDYDLRRVLTG